MFLKGSFILYVKSEWKIKDLPLPFDIEDSSFKRALRWKGHFLRHLRVDKGSGRKSGFFLIIVATDLYL